MASTFTTNKLIEKPANGDYVNTWDQPVNTDFDVIDTAFGGTTNINAVGASGTVTLSDSQYRPPNIIIAGLLSANVNYQLPSGKGGVWSIYNNTTGNFTVTFSSAGGGTSLLLRQGYRSQVISDGTNISYSSTNSLPGGSNTQVQYNDNGVLAGSANFTFDGTYVGTRGLTFVGATSGFFGLIPAAVSDSTVYTWPGSDGAAGYVLATDGSGNLSWAVGGGGGGGVASFSGGTTGLTPATASTGIITLAGTLTEANGGTGETTYTNGQILIGNAAGGLTKATLTAGTNVTITNGDGSITINSSGGGGGSDFLNWDGAFSSAIVTASTAAPFGGNDGDVWFRY
jgi:hypothetical protein